MIGIIDYGLGNVKAFVTVYKNLNIPCMVAKDARDFENASKLILPGVGAFDYAMQRLEESGLRQPLDELVLECRMPILGICVGMQILARSSEEGKLPGLGWIDADVKKFNSASAGKVMQVPHMGWNDIKPVKANSLLRNLETDARFYFLHSFYVDPNESEDVIAVTDYYGEFACAVNSRNVFGVQFHPEKSHQNGIQLLKNFANM